MRSLELTGPRWLRGLGPTGALVARYASIARQVLGRSSNMFSSNEKLWYIIIRILIDRTKISQCMNRFSVIAFAHE